MKDLGEKEDAVLREELDGAGGKTHQNSRPVGSPAQARSEEENGAMMGSSRKTEKVMMMGE